MYRKHTVARPSGDGKKKFDKLAWLSGQELADRVHSPENLSLLNLSQYMRFGNKVLNSKFNSGVRNLMKSCGINFSKIVNAISKECTVS